MMAKAQEETKDQKQLHWCVREGMVRKLTGVLKAQVRSSSSQSGGDGLSLVPRM